MPFPAVRDWLDRVESEPGYVAMLTPVPTEAAAE
jgi:hypothetical protein